MNKQQETEIRGKVIKILTNRGKKRIIANRVLFEFERRVYQDEVTRLEKAIEELMDLISGVGEKEFDDQFEALHPNWQSAAKSFISTLLQNQRKEIVRELEGMKRTLDEQALEVLHDAGNIHGKNYYNEALTDAIQRVKEL